MSAAVPPVIPSTTSVGFDYGIAIAVSLLVLFSTIILASYACIRVKATAASTGGSRDDDENTLNNSVEPSAELVMGLDGSIIETYPIVVIGESLRLPRPNDGPCSICLCDYKANDSVRCIPDCHHCFHSDCVDEWLKMSATCPLCRNSSAATPVTTPLSDVVPLTFRAR